MRWAHAHVTMYSRSSKFQGAYSVNPLLETSPRGQDVEGRALGIIREVAQPNFGRFSQISALQLKSVGLEN